MPAVDHQNLIRITGHTSCGVRVDPLADRRKWFNFQADRPGDRFYPRVPFFICVGGQRTQEGRRRDAAYRDEQQEASGVVAIILTSRDETAPPVRRQAASLLLTCFD